MLRGPQQQRLTLNYYTEIYLSNWGYLPEEMSWQREVLILDMVSEPLNQAQETLADLDRTDNIQDNRVEMTSFLTP